MYSGPDLLSLHLYNLRKLLHLVVASFASLFVYGVPLTQYVCFCSFIHIT
jgi:hypothetical protein